MRIALLEDDHDQAKLVSLWLDEAGHQIIHFDSGREAVKGVVKESFDLLILDWMVPDMSGLEVLKWVRENVEWHIPVLFVTQRDTEEDVVSALESGADDFMTKPVKRMELLARINSIARRVGTVDEANTLVEFPPFVIDRAIRVVKSHDEEIELTQKEYELTLFLFRNAGRVLSRGHILETVWGRSSEVNTRTVDTHISRLRRKLGISPENGWKLTSIYQHGYRLERTQATEQTH